MAEHKEALSSLSPLSWDEFPHASPSELENYLKTAFAHAERILNSIPYTSAPADTSITFTPAPANSATKAVDTLCDPTTIPLPPYPRDETAIKGHGKPYKLAVKDNPLGVNVYKSAAHDRRGAWFARRSVHQGIGFEKWRKSAGREFGESLGIQEGPGSGAVRGVGADRRVERRVVEELGVVEVWQTSSAFPGPVTPRESLTIVINTTHALSPLPDSTPSPRHFLLISRPTTHASAPNRPNLVKMSYESAEMIREIPIPGNADPERNPIEWLMITRSDPGGGIPKFMVERGTPGSIAGDVVKFLDWAIKKDEKELDREIAEDEAEDARRAAEPEASSADSGAGTGVMTGGADAESASQVPAGTDAETKSTTADTTSPTSGETPLEPDQAKSYYNKLTTAAASYLPTSLSNNASTSTPTLATSASSSSLSSDSSGSFRSALSARHYSTASHDPTLLAAAGPTPDASTSDLPTQDQNGDQDLDAPQPTTQHKHNKEIQKLLAKRQALTDKHRADRAALAAKTREIKEQVESAKDGLSLARTKTEAKSEARSSQSSLAKDGAKDGDRPASATGSVKEAKAAKDKEDKEARAREAQAAKETKAREKETKEKEKALSKAERDAEKREERYRGEIVNLDAKRVKEEKREGEKVLRAREREEADTKREEASNTSSLQKEIEGLRKEMQKTKTDSDGLKEEVATIRERAKKTTQERDEAITRAEKAEAALQKVKEATS